ncbi:hypothetical protein HMPREF9151_00552 [Hoylesella saccharolytica F0055]|uniref:Uncharacterized protein n=1 Tax=Hoylesella saccharolytica F0055 TaxID=1127699 RepID=L1NHV2_9BACT|nr:hypothetical protein HMPREF9151_00552 [Hoylesella saccharolytica F0055]
MLAIETNKLMCACKYAGILLLWGVLTISKFRLVCCFLYSNIPRFTP